MARGHSHNHLHRRQHHHRQNDDPFNFNSAINSIESQAASFFGLGPGSGPNNPRPTPIGPQPDPPNQPTTATGKESPNHLEIRIPDADLGDNPGNGNGNGNKGQTTIYVTASWTGTGSFSLSTMEPQPLTASQRDPQDTSQDPDSTTFRKSTRRGKPTSNTDAGAAASTTGGAAAASATAAATLASVLDSASNTSGLSSAATTSGISSAASNSTASAGLSGGAKAGIAIGVIFGILALVAGAFALWRMKKNRDEDAYEIHNSSEKNPFADSASAAQPPPMAASTATYPNPSYTGPQAAPASNPFGSGAVPVAPQTMTSGPMSNMSGNTAMTVGAGAGLVGASIVGAEAAKARRTSVPTPLNLNRAQSPALIPPPVIASSPHGSAFSESSTLTNGAMSAVGGAGAGAPGGPRMHRVQMDFNPTMGDELQISAGEIVRIVREFDDGWCSVEIMQRDSKGNVIRNQSGVVPRTCLSRLPLKPRQKRPGPPSNAPSGPPMNTPAGRMQSPALVPNTITRSMSPGPYGGGPQDRPQSQSDNRPRSNSTSEISNRQRLQPIGLSPMNPASQGINMPNQENQIVEPFVAPLVSDHTRNGSVGSAAPTFQRKPVPGAADA